MTSATTLLIDADIVAFQIAATAQQKVQFPGCEPDVVADDWEEVKPRIHWAIADIRRRFPKSDPDVLICLSCPHEENWRLNVLPTYKGNRDYANRPVHLASVKDYMADNWPSYRKPGLEADDVMGILNTHPRLVLGRKVVVSEDKDMEGNPGWLFNPAKDTKPRLITKEAADRWHLYQTICGDSVDNYDGCPGAGHEKALMVLDYGLAYTSWEHTFQRGPRKGLTEVRWGTYDAPHETPWSRVVSLYAKHGLTEEDALIQARVARICRATDYDFDKKEVRLWTPEK